MRLWQRMKENSAASQWLTLAAVLLILGASIAWSLYSEHHNVDLRERERLATQAKIIDENLGNRLEAIYKTLAGVRRDRALWNSTAGRTTVSGQLVHLADAMQGVRTLTILDAKGIVIAASRESLIGMNLSDREYFRAARQGNDPEMLYVSPPFTTVLGPFAINMVRVVADANGAFAGIVAVTLDPQYFHTLLDSVRYTPDMWTALGHGDGKQFMMVPSREGMGGVDLKKPGSFFSRHLESGQVATVLTGIVYVTGEERMMAQRTVMPAVAHMDKPLVVAISRDLPAIFAAWRRDAYAQIGWFAVLVLVTTWSLCLYQKRQRAYGRLVADQEEERRLAELQLRIAAVTFQSQEGMVVTDASNVILRVNQAFTEVTGYSAEETIGQTPRLLKSGRHDDGFYAEMWRSIARTGAWQGEIWNRRKNGGIFPQWLTITAVTEEMGRTTHYVGTFIDITSRKAAEEEIKNLAFFDPLTALPNRRLLLDRLKQALASSTRSGRYGALLFIDLDDFKTINDTLGHDTGDQLLQQVGNRLATCVREGDTVSRLGGDEFVVMLEDLSEDLQESAAQAKVVGEKILNTLNQTYLLAGQNCRSTPSIGITLFADHLETSDELLKRADLAMYEAKTAGRNTLRFFDPEMQAVVTTRAELETDLRNAVLNDEFLLYYQVQVDGAGHMTGVEALVRWQHPVRGLVAPAEFIPLAEETGLILPLGHWVLEHACAQLVIWSAKPEMAHLSIAVNVSARQFHQKDFVDQVLAVLSQTGADARYLKLELTESLLVDDVEDVIAKMTALKEQGVGFSLDDFGTGYSSLSYLKRLPLDQLKIDQGFVRDILRDPNDAAIARMVVALAGSLGLAVIAEGVETQKQKDFLIGQGCHAYQGYLFSRPLPLDRFEEYVRRA